MAYLSREESQRLAERVLSFSKAEEARVNIASSQVGNIRFAENQVSTAGDETNLSITVTSSRGRRVASATSNLTDDESIRRMVETSENLGRLAPADPEFMGELGPQQYLSPDAVFPSTLQVAPEARARAVAAVAEPAIGRGLVSTGFAMHGSGSLAVATTTGLFGYHAYTRANFTTTVRTPDGTGSGWAGIGADDWNEIDHAALGTRATEKAEASRNPRAVEPGRWTVILEPAAVANMVTLMMQALDARAADEGRSFFSRPGGGNRIGERFIDDRVNIASDPMEPTLSGAPFDAGGVPARRTEWVRDGRLNNLIYSRYWAQRNGREASGLNAAGFFMRGGDASLDEMIRSTQRGLLVTRLYYIRSVDPRTILFTGLTRDGTFLIENGRVSHPVKNLRWNESPISILNKVEMLGPAIRISNEQGNLIAPVSVPALKVREFNFTSVSDAV